MGYQSVLKDILKDYEKRRERGEAVKVQRLENLYATEPRLREIDGELRLTGLNLARLAINGRPGEAEALREVNSMLRN